MVHFVTTITPNWGKQLLFALCLHLLSPVVFCAYAQPANPSPNHLLTAEERAWLAAHPTIALSPDPAYQPVEFFDEQGVYRGISAEYIALIEQRLGFRFQVINRNDNLAAFNAGQMRIEAMPSCAATPNRMKDWMFTTPYLEFPTYIITRKSVTETLTLDQLSGYRVAVVGNYAAREYLVTNYPQLVLDQVPDARTGLQKVSFGLADAFVSELPVATYWMEREGITNLKTSGEAGYVYRLGFGMSKEIAPLHGILEKGLAQITPGERAAIYRKWVRIEKEPSLFARRLGWALLGGFSLVGLGVFFVLWWNRSLAAQVKQRTDALQQELIERKRIEQQLRSSEERFQTIFRSSPAPLAIARFADGKVLDANEGWLRISGYDREELVGQLASETSLWPTLSRRDEILNALGQGQNLHDWEVRYQNKSGEERVGSMSIEVLRLNGELCNLWAVLDLTDRKKAEEALQKSEALFRSLTETTNAWVFIAQGTRLRYCNAIVEQSLGYARTELVGQEFWSLIHPDDYHVIQKRIERWQQGLPLDPQYEMRAVTKQGETRWLQVNTTTIEYEEARADLSTAFDITDRKRAEEALQTSEELFRSLTESTSAWVFIAQGTKLRYFNTAAEAGTGYTRAEIADKEIWSIVHPDDHQFIRDRIAVRQQGLPLPLIYESRILTKAGQTRWMQVTTTRIEYEGTPAELSTAFDITDRQHAEEALQKSEEMFRSLTETTTAWVYIIQKGRLCYTNAATELGTGYTREEMRQKSILDLILPADQEWVKERIHARQHGEPVAPNFEVRVVTKAGETRWLQVVTKLIEYQNASAVLSTAFDITERKRTEEALQQSEHMFRSLTETTSAWVFIEQNDCCVYVNSAAEAGTEFTRDELATMKIWKLVYPDDQQWIYERVQSRRKGVPLPPSYEVRVMTKSGQLRWLQMTTTPIEYKGAPAVLGTAFDITDRKRAEVGLQKSEELFRSLTESTTAWVYVFQNRRLTYVNPAAEKAMGYTRDELSSLAFEQFVHPDELEWHKARIAAHYAGQEVPSNIEARAITKSGEVRWLAVTTKPIEYQGAPAILNTAFDITDRKRAEEAVRVSEATFRSLMESTSAWVWIVQGDQIAYANPAALTGIGYSVEEVLGLNPWQVVHPDDQKLIKDWVSSGHRTMTTPPSHDTRVITKNGEVRWIRITARVIQYHGTQAMLSTAFDITERKHAVEALQKSEELFRSLTETTTAWVYIVQDSRFCYVNAAAEKGIGYTRQELASMTFDQLGHPDETGWLYERFTKRPERIGLPSNLEVRVFTKTGEMRWLAVAAKIIEYQGKPALLNTAFDITDRKLAEEQLKISEQRLHQLAGYLQTAREQERTSIAREIHDELGQSMTALKMDLAWLTKNVPSEQTSLHERLRGMNDVANDTIKTVRRLATQLRPGVLDDLGLLAALEWQAQEFQTRTGITCEFMSEAEINDLAPEHATALFRICQEALTNVARHAQATQVNIHLWAEGNHLLLKIKDNGRGITINETTNSRSFGLLGMQERAFLLGGEFQLTGGTNEGTTVTARIPLAQSMAKGGGL